MKFFTAMLKDQSGASAAEYALLLAIIGAAVAVASITLAGAIANAMDNTANCIKAGTNAKTVCK